MSTQNDEDKKVFVKNIPSSVTDKEITDFFQFAGKTVSVVVKQIGEVKEATIVFEKVGNANAAHLLNGSLLGGSHITVSMSSDADADSSDPHQPSEVAKWIASGIVAVKKVPFYDQASSLVSKAASVIVTIDQKYELSRKATDAASVVKQKAVLIDESYHLHEKVESVKPVSAALNVVGGFVKSAYNHADQIYHDTAILVAEATPTNENENETKPNIAEK